MKSPFPGMDPYLESRWSDVHATLAVFIQEALQPLLPSALRARVEEQAPPEDLAEPMVIEDHLATPRPRWTQIIDTTSGNRLVTVIEILSPWNMGPGRLNKEYCRKVNDYCDTEVSLVELHLLRHPPHGRLEITEAERLTPYLAVIRCCWKPGRWEIYPIPLRHPLPRIPIPLRQNDPAISLDLQPLIERVYVAGGHDDIDYRKPPDPPLAPDDAAWADALLKAAGRR
ncbi:MAG: DUF4058 family protein [Tepidisphaeraceae bacterium]|jgi:hypothetical protein